MRRAGLVLETGPFAEQLRHDLLRHCPPLEPRDLVFLRLLEHLLKIPAFWRSKDAYELIVIEGCLIRSMLEKAPATLAWAGLPPRNLQGLLESIESIAITFSQWQAGPLRQAVFRQVPGRPFTERHERLCQLYRFLFEHSVQYDSEQIVGQLKKAFRRATRSEPQLQDLEDVTQQIISRALEGRQKAAFFVTGDGVHHVDPDAVRDLVRHLKRVPKLREPTAAEVGQTKVVRRLRSKEVPLPDDPEDLGPQPLYEHTEGTELGRERVLLVRAVRRFRSEHRGDPGARAAGRYLLGQCGMAGRITLAEAAERFKTTVAKVRAWTDTRKEKDSRILRELRRHLA